MSIDASGIGIKVIANEVVISIYPSHPLIKLANTLDWEGLKDIVLPDLKASTFKD